MERIAIVGLSCLFPDAKNPEEFWQNLVAQKDSTSAATVEEMGVDPTIFYDPVKGKPDKTYSLQGGYIRNFEFEPTGYNLPSEFIEGLDPLFKGSLYVAKQALQDSKYLGNEKVLSKCGVILGNLSFPTQFSKQLCEPIYHQTIESAVRELLQDTNFRLANSQTSAKVSPYNAMVSGLPAALVAQAFSLSGINFVLDSACSSSLYAVKLACHYLLSHKADMMLAGAISYSDSLFVRMGFAGIQAYPENGISRPLDKSSRGLIPADGIGMVVLKRYSDAIRDGDRIYATICGTGLSNDGRGRHLLIPNPQGLILAFERAYAEAGISPKNIDYLECHATGTLLGDTTELSCIDAFFGQHKAAPLVGSVKSNVGHMLTAAGMASIIKVILSMSNGVIPPTINLTEPLSSPNNVIGAEQIVRSVTPWPNNCSPKRAAINAFGFGGNNAHLILEQGGKAEQVPSAETKLLEPVTPTKMAIVGMDAFFGSCNGLNAFERTIYDGNQHFIKLPSERWKGIEEQQQLLKDYGFEGGEAPKGAYIKDFEIDTVHFKILPNEADINPQQLLILKVADRALRDAGLGEGKNVAVIIAMEADLFLHQPLQRCNLPWQIEEGLKAESMSLPSEQISELETIVKDSIHKAVKVSDCLGYLGNLMASRISALWNFTGPSLTLSAGENSAFKALEVAQTLLAAGEVEAVVVGAVDLAGGVENVLLRNQLAKINTGANTLGYDRNANGWMVGEGAGAVVLKRFDTAQQEQDRIYAVIDAISLVQERATSEKVNGFLQPPVAEAVTQACQKAFTEAGVQPADIHYMEVFGSGVDREDEAEIGGLTQVYQTNTPELSCAIGSVKANIGHTYTASGIASLIKTALCLYNRYIPATPKWTSPKKPEVWQGSSFYVPTESRPWFLEEGASKRVAAINGLGLDGTYAHIILSEESSHREVSSRYLEQMPFYLFPIAAGDRSALLEQLSALQETIENCASLSAAASQAFVNFEKRREATYALVILGRNKDELTQEIQRALQGVANAFDTGKDWQTPVGSYFTAKPQGKQGTIAFVYPGFFNSYIGLGRNIFRLFPKIYELGNSYVAHLGQVLKEKLLYPRSLNSLSRRQLETLEQQLLDDEQAMLNSGVGFAIFFTAIMQDCFQVKPQSVLGYSLGETTMICAQSLWANYHTDSLSSSPLFKTRLSGPRNAVREYWGLPQLQNHEGGDCWSSFVLMAPASQVRECLKHENRVYLTHINTPKEVVIAGDTQACQRVIQTLNCDVFPVPVDHVLHCEAMRSEYRELVRISTFPLQKVPDTVFYSAAEYKPITLDSHSIAHNIATNLCQQLDFPRLINRVYEDGTRIFVEAGAASTCSRWIGEILKQKEHVTVSLNKRGVDDHTSIVKALAKLVSHRVSLDLSPLYCQMQESSSKGKSVVKTITLGGSRISSTILSYKDKKIFTLSSSSLIQKPAKQQHRLPNLKTFEALTSPKLQSSPMTLEENGSKSILINSSAPQEEIRFEEFAAKEANNQQVLASTPTNYGFVQELDPSELHPQYQQLSTNNSRVTQTHAAFLQARQQSLKQISETIQLQLALSQQMLDSDSLVSSNKE